jgi:tetratricopeptide (TPR) repeat protein
MQGGSERTDATRAATSDARSGAAAAPTRELDWPRHWPLWLFAGYAALALAIYWPAIDGPFVSDDFAYLVSHPYTSPLSWENVRAILDPFGPAKLYAANYEPVHLLLTALELHIFADAMRGYHLVNVAIHALCALLLSAWLRRADLGFAAALFGGLFFLVHPANVEAVAWASQLKTNAALAFALGAILAWQRAPLAAALLFACSLLTKASGLFALPTVAALAFAQGSRALPAARWLALWVVALALFAIPEMQSFAHLGAVEVEAYGDPWVHARSVAAVGSRYLVMAATGWGVSAFQEPAPTLSWTDPWWLASLPLGVAIGARSVRALARRSAEGAFWVAAAASFAPVSQIFPFLNPVADRYLYFILPGLIGGALCWGREVAVRWIPPARERVAGLVAAGLGAALLLGFAGWSASRAALWQSETRLLLDAARHYPEGGTAHYLRARNAAQRGDVAQAIASLRIAARSGIDRFNVIDRDPGLAPIREAPEFRALMRELAQRWIELAERRGYETQPELRMLAMAHATRGELEAAVQTFERALAAGGPLDDVLRGELAEARSRLARERASGGGESGGTSAR